MSNWLSPAHLTLLIEWVIGLSVLEGLALWVYHRATGRGPAVSDFLLNLISGLCLMLALRSAMLNSGWALIAMWMLAAGIAHWTDLWMHWRPTAVTLAKSAA